jgi:hypothetical protein
VFVYDKVRFVKFAKVEVRLYLTRDPELALKEFMTNVFQFQRAAGIAEELKQVRLQCRSIYIRFHLRLTLAHLDSPKTAGKAALLTFPNRNRFSSCQDWRVIIGCY